MVLPDWSKQLYCGTRMERYINILIGLLAIVGVVVMIVKRPIAPKFRRWVLAHKSLVDTVAPFVFILWGGMIWALLILKSDFSNVPAMIVGSVIICMGVFFFFKRY
jgi:hypothetical protein